MFIEISEAKIVVFLHLILDLDTYSIQNSISNSIYVCRIIWFPLCEYLSQS